MRVWGFMNLSTRASIFVREGTALNPKFAIISPAEPCMESTYNTPVYNPSTRTIKGPCSKIFFG